ncbi:hypothetical protein HU200_020288 [Digitaria exilis]|uniref:Rx N-terminal domain-containing protein n=1 Tax=Digitaria exilis TaxID=1010633 RepID=A0A835F1U2_9POAL|nr:hypothetical protein HU200_020288 [Digitaria exilis]CAB3463766.1 unnamed protein product [Digitaria exilis]
MAELASGAVSSLLRVIGNEARLLRGVEEHVQFIKEEMQSMNSFLLHLARTAPPGGEHDEQVRTWMGQVRLLATDCSSCIDRYVYFSSSDIHLGRGGLRRFLLWAPWFLNKTVAQHRAAVELRALKERAREVGERRQRYDVRIPEKHHLAEAGLTSPLPWAEADADDAAGVDEEDDFVLRDDQSGVAQGMPPHLLGHAGRVAILKPRTLDDYFQSKVPELMARDDSDDTMVSAAVMAAPGADQEAVDLAWEALAVEEGRHTVVVVDIPRVHMTFQPLRPTDILYYILRELQPDMVEVTREEELYWLLKKQEKIERAKESLLLGISQKVQEAMAKLDKIKKDIQDKDKHKLLGDVEETQDDCEPDQPKEDCPLVQKPIDELLLLLLLLQSAAPPDQARSKAMRKLATWRDHIFRIAAERLKMLVEFEAVDLAQQQQLQGKFYDARYKYIMVKVFLKAGGSGTGPQEQDSTVAGQIKEMISNVREMIHGVQEGQGRDGPVIPQDVFAETEKKMEQIKRMIQDLMENKWITDKIVDNLCSKNIDDDHLRGINRPMLVILRIGEKINGSTWEENRYALTLLMEHVAGALVVTTTKSTHQAREYCDPKAKEPIEFSPVGLYYDTVLQLTSRHKNQDCCSPKIIRGILHECEPYEFCMKIFAHTFYAKPKRSNEELSKLCSNLQGVSPKSFANVALKVIKFAYNDLPKEYKSCLLYLAIFPQGCNIRRSTLIARWVIEGLITTDEWPTSVRRAEQCFDTLIDRWLVYPGDIGGTGKVKSCIVDDRVHKFITMIAKKQHIVDTRLSLKLAHHFSIFSDIRLRLSDKIENFLQMLSKLYHFSQLKVLDLEGCKCFGKKNKHYLKDICCNLLLLKYLNLKDTDIIELPIEINNLHELEVLDIRQTNVRQSATRKIRLLKLKRLLTGHIDPCAGSVLVPEKIGKMEDMEVLLGVKPWNGEDLKGIGRLCHLRKLGVVISKDSNLQDLLHEIGNLYEKLKSLSITLPPATELKSTPSSTEGYGLNCPYPPKALKTLSINGTTKMELLPLKTNENNQLTELPLSYTTELLQSLLANGTKQLTKVALRNTLLSHKDMEVLSKLPMLRSVRFRQVRYTETRLTFKKDEFKTLEYFLLNGSNMTDIIFDDEATCKLEKIVLSLGDGLKLSGVNKLPRLEEIELSDNNFSGSYNRSAGTTTIATNINKKMLLSLLDDAKQITKVTLRSAMLKLEDLQILAKMPNVRRLMLLEKSYDESQLTFNKNEFPKLNVLIVNCPGITQISFTAGSCPKLEKFVWTSTKMESLSSIGNLPRLKEIEFKGEFISKEVKEDINKHKNRIYFTHYKLENKD